MSDPVLDTLLRPLSEGLVDWPVKGPALFLRPRFGQALSGIDREKLLCQQMFKPAHDALVRSGFAMSDGDGERFDLTLVLPPRQREECRALLARAVVSVRDGGIVMTAVSNLEGAKTVESDLKSLAGNVTSLSKNKCRVFWARIDERRRDDLIAQWAQLDAPRDIGGFVSRPGLFAWDRIDAGSKLLAQNLPATLARKGADLGAGFGYLTREVFEKCPGIAHMDVFEAEARALDLARLNLASFDGRTGFHWLDVTKGLPDAYDFIISNPPFHTDRADRHELGQGFIKAAAAALNPGGQFWMVANRHLPYEATLKAAFKTVVIIADNGAFKVFKAIGPQAAER